jgi:DNA-binding beta-propeller fold protein YncE
MRSLLLAAALAASTLAFAQTATPVQVLEAHTINTDGHPTQAIWTPDGQYILVTVTIDDPFGTGIEVFHVEGSKLKRVAFEPLGDEPAQGILLIPHTRTLAVGLSNAGVVFLSLDATLQGNADPHVLKQGDHSGSTYLAATPDGNTLFVANESLLGGSVGVIALRHDPKGQIVPEAVAQLPTPIDTLGIALSPDGKRLYALDEFLAKNLPERLPGHDNPELRKTDCVDAPGSPSNPNGGLFVLDTAKAAAPPTDFSPQHERDATLQLFNAGCSPVRVAVSSDNRTLYVTARGDDAVLVFDAAALEHDPEHAFLRSIPTGGIAPVGLALFDHDRKLLVANSNSFSNSPGNATVIDLSNPADSKVVQTIKTGDFPRNVTASPDGRSLLLTVYLEDQLMILTMK